MFLYPRVGRFRGLDAAKARERMAELFFRHDLTRMQAMYVAADEQRPKKTLWWIFGVNSGSVTVALQAARKKMVR
ncbi:MAG: hypothetical protein GX224_04490 [Thermoplasmatales archaeon]|nr:hypothetical protein [Thermoplasmatales archaeon]